MQNVFFKRDKNGNCLSLSLSFRDKNAFLSVPQNCPGEGQKRDFRFCPGQGQKRIYKYTLSFVPHGSRGKGSRA